ncbi:hypothetical protein [Bacillus sp. AFS033286]|uniref:hypothetical protein n=1 Tax=Bacillus sp. AFS033286 TaxID=2033498 RepID=UPI000BFE9237|nr:hypothetical protein [Bacillus sp. AFS033286]PGX12091.1 hypothetical protein COE07_11065 [Bacillus sp. AFS033286]
MLGYLCECGGNLCLMELKTYEKMTRINKDGVLTKRISKPYPSHLDVVENYGGVVSSRLVCLECPLKYEFKGLDEVGRIVRGGFA